MMVTIVAIGQPKAKQVVELQTVLCKEREGCRCGEFRRPSEPNFICSGTKPRYMFDSGLFSSMSLSLTMKGIVTSAAHIFPYLTYLTGARRDVPNHGSKQKKWLVSHFSRSSGCRWNQYWLGSTPELQPVDRANSNLLLEHKTKMTYIFLVMTYNLEEHREIA